MMNKTMKLTLGVLLVSLCSCFLPTKLVGQVAIQLKLNQKRYLRFESVFAELKIRNYSPNVVMFSDSPGYNGELKFDIDRPGGGVLMKRSYEEIPVKGVLLKPGETKTYKYNLSKYYRIFDIGQYRVTAILSHPSWPTAYKSNTVSFNVGEGLNVVTRIFGVPDPMKPGKTATRKYSIKSAYNGKLKVYYLIVEDDRMIYQVAPIGYDVGVGIRYELDGLNRLHILLQANPRIYAYFVFDINGKRILKEIYNKVKHTPQFYRDPKNGKITVVGGRKAIEGIDYKPDDGTLFGRGGSNIAPPTPPTEDKAPVVDN